MKSKILSKDPRAVALRGAISARDPFSSGICAIPDYQHFLYYTDGDVVRRIDVANTSVNDLNILYHACQPAEFGRGKETVLDESYRKAGKMDLGSFSTLLDPRSLGIDEEVSKALLTEHGLMSMELYKMNVYAEGDFFKAHRDTPRDQDMFGSLVVFLPTRYEGGQLVLRQDGKEWSFDFRDKFADAKGASVCYVAFYSDVEHEVLPVTSGYRVTLTYNLYRRPALPATLPILTPQHLSIREALVSLVNDKSVLPNGGYLGFGLVHDYVHTGCNILSTVSDQLKGSDRALVDVCDTLGLCYTLRLLYRNMVSGDWEGELNILTTKELSIPPCSTNFAGDSSSEGTVEYIPVALEGFTIQEAEVVQINNKDRFSLKLDLGGLGGQLEMDKKLDELSDQLSEFCRDPLTQVMEITPMKSSVNSRTGYVIYGGNEADLNYFYGTACILVAVDPVGSRQSIVA